MRTFQKEQQVILISAGTAARRAAMRERVERLGDELDWERLGETLRMRKLLPTLGPRVIEMAGSHVSEGFRAVVNESIETGRRQGAFLQLVTARAVGMLADAGIRATPLKGPVLGEAIYGDLGRRLSSDVDLLVAPAQLDAAVDVMRTLGYGAPTDHVSSEGLPLLHFALLHEREELPPLEMHWRVHWYEPNFARDRLLPPSAESSGDWRPTNEDQLAALLLFYARDGFVDLRIACDLGAWWDTYGADMPDHGLTEVLSRYPALEPAIVAAAKVAERTVDLPAALVLGKRNRSGVRQRMAVRLANPNPRLSQSQVYADMGLIDGLLTPRGDFGMFVRRQIFPPSEVLDQQARHASRRRARSPVVRSVGILARYSVSIVRSMRAPAGLD